MHDFPQKNRQILFLHGYLADSKIFYKQFEFFSRDFDIYSLDLKGFGENNNMEYPYSLDEYILEVKDFMKKNNLKCPNVIAHSFGGRIVLKGTATKKLKFDKLILTGCAGLKPRFSIKKCTKKITFSMLKNFVKRERLKRFYSKDYLALSPIMKESFNLIVREYLDCYLKDISNRTLIINGRLDKDVPIYQAKRLHKGIENSTLSIFENAGHFCFLDKPNKFNLEVKEFLLS